ncbi:DUF6265 family protein [Pedobacter sp. PLR]|uniref:DUF6265 family protein n=1 Tax=Pedobacter sp. PLR TaxID=2994465 RepID=UPI0022454A12|nr:DUF6265 family protein [Pedobacter sp. PLR]MCX2451507.1 DUF6265 family protein [Pedobacter sp. PLR]
MKTLKLLLFIPAFLIINTACAQVNIPQKFKKLEWLTGKWKRTNPKAGESGHEIWAKSGPLKLIGKGVTLKGTTPTFIENLEFSVKGKDIYYIVMMEGDEQPTYFKLTSLAADGFTCENPEHDFPKKIRYKRTGKNMKAVISGGGKTIDFDFIKDKSQGEHDKTF